MSERRAPSGARQRTGISETESACRTISRPRTQRQSTTWSDCFPLSNSCMPPKKRPKRAKPSSARRLPDEISDLISQTWEECINHALECHIPFDPDPFNSRRELAPWTWRARVANPNSNSVWNPIINKIRALDDFQIAHDSIWVNAPICS